MNYHCADEEVNDALGESYPSSDEGRFDEEVLGGLHRYKKDLSGDYIFDDGLSHRRNNQIESLIHVYSGGGDASRGWGKGSSPHGGECFSSEPPFLLVKVAGLRLHIFPHPIRIVFSW